MSKVNLIKILYRKDDTEDYVNLLQSNTKYKHRLTFAEQISIQRFADGSVCNMNLRQNKRRLIIEGESNPPDIYQLPEQAPLMVLNSLRFYSNLAETPEYADPQSVILNDIRSYRIVLHMITTNFSIEVEDLGGFMKWQWHLEEI